MSANDSFGEFTCPKCGGHYFGTGNPSAPTDEWKRRCHGDKYKPPCGFTWLGVDDHKYFKPVKK